MYERYTERARRTIFFAKEEAVAAKSSYIEPEHLLLAIIQSCEPELNDALKLRDFESDLRAEFPGQPENIGSKRADVPLSNQSRRLLGNAAEEADKLNSFAIEPRRLLLGILRETESPAARFLSAHGIDLASTRRVAASLPTEPGGPTTESILRHDAWIKNARRRSWISQAMQIVLFVLLAILMSRSQVSGKHLLVAGIAWMLGVCFWRALRKGGIWGFKVSNRHRVIAASVVYGVLWLYQILLFGWVVPLGIGIYRTIAWP